MREACCYLLLSGGGGSLCMHIRKGDTAVHIGEIPTVLMLLLWSGPLS